MAIILISVLVLRYSAQKEISRLKDDLSTVNAEKTQLEEEVILFIYLLLLFIFLWLWLWWLLSHYYIIRIVIIVVIVVVTKLIHHHSCLLRDRFCEIVCVLSNDLVHKTAVEITEKRKTHPQKISIRKSEWIEWNERKERKLAEGILCPKTCLPQALIRISHRVGEGSFRKWQIEGTGVYLCSLYLGAYC